MFRNGIPKSTTNDRTKMTNENQFRRKHVDVYELFSSWLHTNVKWVAGAAPAVARSLARNLRPDIVTVIVIAVTCYDGFICRYASNEICELLQKYIAFVHVH